MGTIRKKGAGYEAAVALKGVRKSKTCRTKAEANMWIAEMEKSILSQQYRSFHDATFGELMDRYGKTVSITKRGKDFELKRINALARDDEIANIHLSDLNKSHFVMWRDRWLESVSPATVIRE